MDKPSRKIRDEKDRTGQAGQDMSSRTIQAKQDRIGRAGREDDLGLDSVSSFELETNQYSSGFI
jgi:hypothetical protein